MTEIEFREGIITYKVDLLSMQDVEARIENFSRWDGGYLAFSNWECKLNDEIKKLSLRDSLNRQFKKSEIPYMKDAEGYLMEIGLWRDANGLAEEICIEREDRGFIVQTWSLQENKEYGNCYYRNVDTMPRRNSIFKDDAFIRSYEVVWPERRLHFFITTMSK